MPDDYATYLGDGAYATMQANGSLMITTGHHLEHKADAAMWLGETEIKKLIEFLVSPSEVGDLVHPE